MPYSTLAEKKEIGIAIASCEQVFRMVKIVHKLLRSDAGVCLYQLQTNSTSNTFNNLVACLSINYCLFRLTSTYYYVRKCYRNMKSNFKCTLLNINSLLAIRDILSNDNPSCVNYLPLLIHYTHILHWIHL